jgi:predicted DNA-binding transcriptional regulator AlpA
MQSHAGISSSAAHALVLTQEQVAAMLQVSPRTLEDWRLRGGGPPFVKASRRCVRYPRAQLEAWIDSRTVGSTTEADRLH